MVVQNAKYPLILGVNTLELSGNFSISYHSGTIDLDIHLAKTSLNYNCLVAFDSNLTLPGL